MKPIAQSELILNADGSIYHLNLKPNDIANDIIFVGDQERVSKVTQYFDTIESTIQKREFKTITGTFKNKEQLITSLIKNQQAYGFNGLQYATKIQELKKLFHSFNPVEISKTGKQILENQLNYYGKIRSDFSYLGGSKKYSYLYVNDTDKLLKISQ